MSKGHDFLCSKFGMQSLLHSDVVRTSAKFNESK